MGGVGPPARLLPGTAICTESSAQEILESDPRTSWEPLRGAWAQQRELVQDLKRSGRRVIFRGIRAGMLTACRVSGRLWSWHLYRMRCLSSSRCWCRSSPPWLARSGSCSRIGVRGGLEPGGVTVRRLLLLEPFQRRTAKILRAGYYGFLFLMLLFAVATSGTAVDPQNDNATSDAV